jgi:membrane protease YdiL (CAAX protease family)
MPRESLGAALGLTFAVWTLLSASALARPALGDASTLIGVGSATLLVLAVLRPCGLRPALGPALLACGAGFASLPAWLAVLAPAGSALGLAPRSSLPAPVGLLRTLCDVGLGPLLEEALYRGRVLPALRRALGAPLALLLSSALFAVPHGDGWLTLAAFGLGLALGGAYLATRSLAVCIGYHAGLNLAAAALVREAFPVVSAGLATALAWLLFGAAILHARAARPA